VGRWVEKQKGLLQVLHERGMLDEEKYAAKFYTIIGQIDNDDASSQALLLRICWRRVQISRMS
jgi:hypothetical protein